ACVADEGVDRFPGGEVVDADAIGGERFADDADGEVLAVGADGNRSVEGRFPSGEDGFEALPDLSADVIDGPHASGAGRADHGRVVGDGEGDATAGSKIFDGCQLLAGFQVVADQGEHGPAQGT